MRERPRAVKIRWYRAVGLARDAGQEGFEDGAKKTQARIEFDGQRIEFMRRIMPGDEWKEG